MTKKVNFYFVCCNCLNFNKCVCFNYVFNFTMYVHTYLNKTIILLISVCSYLI